ncbi:MAG TPA: cytochrome c oxidase assembly protein [Solirubrobacterales bacterium]|nr:cytochrome c oxidase assembly protein [Solirubrobacterales bacterium]
MIAVADLDSVLAEWLPPLSLIVIATAYAIRMIRLGDAGRPVPRWRQAFFLGGLVALAVAYVSPVDDLSDELLTWHMVQHLLIMDIAALFFVLGLTGPLLQPLLAMRGFRWMRHLANPIFALAAWTILLYAWHIPALYEAATFESDLVHALQHLCFFFAGVAFWMSLLGPLPKPSWFTGAASAGFVFAVRLIGAVLANVLMWSSSVIYSRYASGEAAHGVSGLNDQGMAGVVMMAESTVITIAILSWLILRWAKHDTERQELLDLAAARGVELDPARAERAVSAGQGERLRERIESGATHSGARGPA